MTADDKSVTTPEQIIEDLGGCGKYQLRMCIVSHAMKTLISWSIVSIVIITKTPDFWCEDNVMSRNVTSNVTSDYDSLGACETVNGTTCNKFTYDETSLKSIVTEFDLVCDNSFVPSFLMSIQSAGNLVGNLAIGQIADVVGRKKPFFGAVLLVTVSDFLTLASRGWVMVAVCKFFLGIGTGAFMTTTYSLMSEFTLARHRVWIISVPSWPIQVCVFCLIAWLVEDWRYMTLISGLVGIPCLLAWWVIPESFRWLLAHGKQDEAEKILDTVANYNGKPMVDPDHLESIVAAEHVDKTHDRKYTFLDLFRTRYLIKIFVLMGLQWYGMGFVGYGIVFGIQELSGNIYLNLFLFMLVAIPAKQFSIWTQNKYGRKITSIICYAIVTIGCLIAAVAQSAGWEKKAIITNVSALIANMAMTMLWGSIQTLTVENYPTVVRNLGFGTLSVLGRIGSVIGPQFLFLGRVTGIPGFMYYCCAAVSLACTLALFGIPETKDANLSDTLEDHKTVTVDSNAKAEEASAKDERSTTPFVSVKVNDGTIEQEVDVQQPINNTKM